MKQRLNKLGYVTEWLVAGPLETPYAPPENLPCTWNDQLGYEKALRGIFFTSTELTGKVEDTRLDTPAPNGLTWEYCTNCQDGFVNKSTFYGLLTCVQLEAVTGLYSATCRKAPAVLWTYAAVEVWVNGQKVLAATPPVYKPIQKIPLVLPLEKGENQIFVRLQNLGVRDTRSIFGLQLEENGEPFWQVLPDAGRTHPLQLANEWLGTLAAPHGALLAEATAPYPAALTYGETRVPISAPGSYTMPEDIKDISVCIQTPSGNLSKNFELLEHSQPMKTGPAIPGKQHWTQFFEQIAQNKWEPRGNGVYFSVFHVLARLATGCPRPDDDELLMRDLDYIESCGDCADFLVIGFLRLLNNYTVNHTVRERAEKVLLNFRYWMDEAGNDGMCFWSENHALMFYGAQHVAGGLFPTQTFTRSARTGAQQQEIGARRCWEWLQDIEQHGAEEFNSASYFPVTLVALLNLVDFAAPELARHAAEIADSLLRQLCLHVFDGSVISPQGRVYRDVIYPYRQSTQSVLHMIHPALPRANTESMWNACLATTHYRFPDDLYELMQQTASRTYTCGNARIVLEKRKDTLLTSVASPRGAEETLAWENICFTEKPNTDSYLYVKSLNERFHGTNLFQPGVYGYQQHLWYAALSSRCVVFTNHPGSFADGGGMRPDYWYGNGVFPALTQSQNKLATIYKIPENHPVVFTHVFWPQCTFDEWEQNGAWLFGRVKNGMVGLWCSGALAPANQLLTGCEYRCHETNTAYFCFTASIEECGNFENFKAQCHALAPEYCHEQAHFTAVGLNLTFTAYENKTQFI